MNVLFMGQKPFGEVAWLMLMESSLNVVAVCTNREPAGWWQTNRIARLYNGPIIGNEERHEGQLLEAIERHNVDMLISVQHPWLLSRDVLEAVYYAAINFHNGKLPDYAGHNAAARAIENGDKEYTVTCHRIDEGMDTGDILDELTFPIVYPTTADQLYRFADLMSTILFGRVLRTMEA